MNILLKNGIIFYKNSLKRLDILISNNKIIKIAENIANKNTNTLDITGLTVIPGLIDVHVHLREPGYEQKETIKTGTHAAAAGGFTCVCCMPNTKPIIDDKQKISFVKSIVKKDALIDVRPYCAITLNQQSKKLVNFKDTCKVCIAYSDDGKSIIDEKIINEIINNAQKYKFITAMHCGDYENNISEPVNVKQHLNLIKNTNVKYHFCHISTQKSLNHILNAKRKNPNITFEVTPHHLLFNNKMITNDGRYKMSPPIGTMHDQQALIESLCNGTLDIIATDHAPHTSDEKALKKQSLNGVVGLETAFSVLYTNFVRNNKIRLQRLIEAMSFNPSRIFNLPNNEIKVGNIANLAIFDLSKKYAIDSSSFLSKGKSSPFDKIEVYGQIAYTILNGKIVYDKTN